LKFQKLAILALVSSASFSVDASNADKWDTFTDVGAYGLIGVALAMPAYKRDWDGFRQAGYSIGSAVGVGYIGKSVITEERPDKSGDDSFPSNHTAGAFAAATTLNLRYGWQVGLPAYGLAALVGVGRVEADKHYWKDVLAGAALGSVAGWLFTDAYSDDVQVVPWVGRNEAGLALSMTW